MIVERLTPGPLCHLLPAMTVPVLQTLSQTDRVMLSLYYRWALQVLSAFSYLHSRSMYIKNFSSQLVWLRSDYSLAITGFICMSALEIEEDFKRDAAEEVRQRKQDTADIWGSASGYPTEEEEDEVETSAWFWDEGEWVGDESIMYDESATGDCERGSVKEDLSVNSDACTIPETDTDCMIAL